jgi:hypothetical protein
VDYTDGVVVLASYFQESAAIYDVSTGEMISRLTHHTPLTRPSPSGNESGGVALSVYLIDCSILNGIVYIVNGSYGKEGTVPSNDSDENANITLIDRYDICGNYLDTIVLPNAVDAVAIENNMLVAANIYWKGTVIVYMVEGTMSCEV